MTEPINIPKRCREVLVVSHYYAAHGGGIERVVNNLIVEISIVGNFRFTWVASNCDLPPTIPGQVMQPMRVLNFLERMCGLPLPLWGPRSLWRLKRAVAASDIVWLHDTLYMGNISAFIMARWMKKPVLITQHIGPITYRNAALRWIMKCADRYITHKMLKLANQVNFISDAVAEHYYRAISFKTPVKIIPNGVDIDIFQPVLPEKRQVLRDQFALRRDQPVLLFVGRFVERKGLSVIRHLAESLPEWRFWLVGRGPIDPNQWRLPNIHVFKDRADATLAELYQAADMLILPSYGEGFPLVIQEAMACGLPVLCSPSVAAGSQIASPYLLTASVDPQNVKHTAQLWTKKLMTQRPLLPLKQAKWDLANFVQDFWLWSRIGGYYDDLLQTMCKRTTR